MTTYLVTRHPATRLWAKIMAERGELPFAIDHHVDHLDVDQLAKGDVVIGTLPVHVGAELHKRGIAFWSLDIDTPPAARGKELSATELTGYGARITRYEVRQKETQEVEVERKQRRSEAKPQPSITLIPVSDQLVPAAIGWLHGPTDEVVLLASPGMAAQAARLKQWFDARKNCPKTIIVPWDDANHSALVQQADDLATALVDDQRPRVVVNLTGGTKLMSMALQRAFGKHRDRFADALTGSYVDTGHRHVANLFGDAGASVPMRSVLNIRDMLALQGMDLASAQSAAPGHAEWLRRTKLFEQLLSRKTLPWLGTWYSVLNAIDELLNPHRRRSRQRQKNDIAVAAAGEPAAPEFRVTLQHSKATNWNGLRGALRGAFGRSLVSHGVCEFELSHDTLALRFAREPTDELAFLKGVWMEVWLAGLAAKAEPEEWAQGVTVTSAGVKNELDLIVLNGNRMLLVEVKTNNLNADGAEDTKATETVYKFDSVADQFGRYFNEHWLVSLRRMGSADIDRAKRHKIVVFHGGEAGVGVKALTDLPGALKSWIEHSALPMDPGFRRSGFEAPPVASGNGHPAKQETRPVRRGTPQPRNTAMRDALTGLVRKRDG